MSQLDTIVNVVIDVQTASVAQTSFGTPLIAAAFAATHVADFGRAQEYGSLAEMVDAGVSGGAHVTEYRRAVGTKG